MLKEPSLAAFEGSSPLRVAKRLFFATRPTFLSASVLPVLLGTGSGHRLSGHLDTVAFVLSLAGFICIHAAGNVLNDVYDDLSGTDRINRNRIFPFTGGSRFIQNGIMTSRQMTHWGIVLLAAAGISGAGLCIMKGAGILAFGFAGSLLFLLYLVPPVQLGARGFGEAAVGLGFGVLPVTAAAWLQAESATAEALLLSVPVAFWIANVLLINEVPDAEADDKTGKRTLAVMLGRDRVRKLYLLLNFFALLAVLAAAFAAILPPAAVTVPVLLCLAAVPASRTIGSEAGPGRALERGIKITLAIHALGTVWLAGWVWSA